MLLACDDLRWTICNLPSAINHLNRLAQLGVETGNFLEDESSEVLHLAIEKCGALELGSVKCRLVLLDMEGGEIGMSEGVDSGRAVLGIKCQHFTQQIEALGVGAGKELPERGFEGRPV